LAAPDLIMAYATEFVPFDIIADYITYLAQYPKLIFNTGNLTAPNNPSWTSWWMHSSSSPSGFYSIFTSWFD
jgi:hypothetical protein